MISVPDTEHLHLLDASNVQNRVGLCSTLQVSVYMTQSQGGWSQEIGPQIPKRNLDSEVGKEGEVADPHHQEGKRALKQPTEKTNRCLQHIKPV